MFLMNGVEGWAPAGGEVVLSLQGADTDTKTHQHSDAVREETLLGTLWALTQILHNHSFILCLSEKRKQFTTAILV